LRPGHCPNKIAQPTARPLKTIEMFFIILDKNI
jgi:hypothetical protein